MGVVIAQSACIAQAMWRSKGYQRLLPLRFITSTIPAFRNRPIPRTFRMSHTDYGEAGKQLIKLATASGSPYNDVTAMLNHHSGAVLFCGGQRTARDKKWLKDNNVSRIVFCQIPEGEKHHADDPFFTYLDFPIGNMVHRSEYVETPQAVARTLSPMFEFVDSSLRDGRSVLIHCLAGAHRAGSTTVAALMFFCDLGYPDALVEARRLRRQIEPIGAFHPMLCKLEEARAANCLPRRIAADGSVHYERLDILSPGSPPVRP